MRPYSRLMVGHAGVVSNPIQPRVDLAPPDRTERYLDQDAGLAAVDK
jgi:hypothetical protein